MSSSSKRRRRKQVEKVYKIIKPGAMEPSRSSIAKNSDSFMTLPIVKTIKESPVISNELKDVLVQEFVQEHNQMGDILTAYGDEFIVKDGKINERLIDRIGENEGIEYANFARANASMYIRNNENLSYKTFLSKLADNRLEKMFINAGWSLEAAATEIGTTPNALGNQDNWVGDTFVDPMTGRVYQFVFQYHGAIWEEIT